ncbi:LysR family transcriptional regulator [Leminorella grimontii]|uniref:LysR family transcriptional regulator n=1 Tax=Leminorella grimontii TaxID=82981 RepID=A0AAV5N340_9GAMM|nr:LysR family transcriptional regulator [Leminorella grimontii]KFC96792.1 LysR family transcriptional regulator [Leminorella grimontii ATCC 33999 = DSM 5078]GKX55938.1 LysR family transcriptional regulator [Leminorella grimontii]GKX58983.1 LysR family transcriptional regulator [Leminorella grimontii]VFS57500.1 HTH-type transcriptional regulator gltC [Leminorella grimontii]
MVHIKRSIPNLELDLLRTFVAVAEGNSFAAAAESVHRTQSAVSQQMQRLELLIGKELFSRSGRNKALTEHGVKMLGYARRILRLNDEACLSLMYDDVDGVLRIGSPDDTADTILPELLSRFSKAYPRLAIEIVVKRSPFLMDMLKNDDVDMAISTVESVDYPSLVLRASPSLWFCGLNYEFNLDEPLPLVSLDEPSTYRNMAINHLDQAGIPWRIAYVATTLSGARAAVVAGLGVMARSIELLGDDLRVLGEAEGLPRLPDIKFNLYMRRNSPQKAAKVLFESLLGENNQVGTPRR